MKRIVYVPIIVLPPQGGEKGPAWTAFPASYNAEERGVPTYWTLDDALANARIWVWHEVGLQSAF